MSRDWAFHAAHAGQYLTLWEDGGGYHWANGYGGQDGGYESARDAINGFVAAECERHQSALQCAADARLTLEASHG